jgi:ABC-type sugar transport system ATPase subunit
VARITLTDVTKHYGPVEAVRGISFEVKDGEYLGLLGPSGCGKSSTMRMIAGLEEITAGTIAIDGEVVNGKTPAQRNTAMAFENYGLYPHMSVFGNIAYPLRLRGLSDDDLVAEVVRAANLLHIGGLLDRRPGELSTGVQQRVSLARALVRRPTVFLLDEPLSHLDADLRSQMRGELKRLQADSGGTMIHVTHDQLEALSLSDRVVVMNEGLIQQIGTPEEIYGAPANRFVATFIGEPPMNIMAATIVDDDVPRVSVEGRAIAKVPEPLVAAVRKADQTEGIEIGVRPRDLLLDGSDETGLPGVVWVREGHGEIALLAVHTAEHRLRVEAPPDTDANDGDSITLRPREDRIHFFERRSGRTIGRGSPESSMVG